MDPWSLILVEDFECLFGFAAYHNGTGGLSWTRSSPVVQLDEARGRARTESGRLYELGRRTEPSAFQDLECLAAFLLLVEIQGSCSHELRALGRWLTTCKMARWLGLQPPSCDPAEVEQFLTAHGKAYRAKLSGRCLC